MFNHIHRFQWKMKRNAWKNLKKPICSSFPEAMMYIMNRFEDAQQAKTDERVRKATEVWGGGRPNSEIWDLDLQSNDSMIDDSWRFYSNFEEPWIKKYLNTCLLKWAGFILVAIYHFPLGTPTKPTGVYLILCPCNLDAKHPIAMTQEFPGGKFSTKFLEIWCRRMILGWERTCCACWDHVKCEFLYQVISSINVIKCYGWEEALPKRHKHPAPWKIW